MTRLQRISRRLSRRVSELSFGPPVSHVYNPLSYARRAHDRYLELARPGCELVLVGMNPGPWGMAQTGVPFGEVAAVRDWLGIREPVRRPRSVHPERPIEGLDCRRSEVSGRRLWGWARQRFGSAERFFERVFVWNYCPLAFLEASGRNRTPDKLPAAERRPLESACDQALGELIELLEPRLVVGVGGFARRQLERVLDGRGLRVGGILHPSPASPLANRGWARQAERQLRELGFELPT